MFSDVGFRFLADADWDYVSKFTVVKDPYRTTDVEAELDQLTTFERFSKCPNCTSEVPSEPSPMEWREMRTEARLRLLKAEKVYILTLLSTTGLNVMCDGDSKNLVEDSTTF